MVEDMDMASAFQYWRDGKLTLGEWRRSFRGLRESAFFAADDRRPMISMCMKDIREVFLRLRRARGTRLSHDRRLSSQLVRRAAKG
jgi:hypothetical protein